MNICHKKCAQYKNFVYYSQGSTGEPKITLTCLISETIRKFNYPNSQGLSFCEQSWTFGIGLLCKANLVQEEFCTSDWLNPCC